MRCFEEEKNRTNEKKQNTLLNLWKWKNKMGSKPKISEREWTVIFYCQKYWRTQGCSQTLIYIRSEHSSRWEKLELTWTWSKVEEKRGWVYDIAMYQSMIILHGWIDLTKAWEDEGSPPLRSRQTSSSDRCWHCSPLGRQNISDAPPGPGFCLHWSGLVLVGYPSR